MDELINKLDEAEERISKLKVNAKEIIQHESLRDKGIENGYKVNRTQKNLVK